MTPEEIDNIAKGWEKLTTAVSKAIISNKSFIEEGYQYLPAPWASDIIHLEASVQGDSVIGEAIVYTNLYGGSEEGIRFSVPLDVVNKYLDGSI